MRPETLTGTNPALFQTYPAVAASVPAARHALTAFAAEAGVSEPQLESIRLAVSEALTNAVLHAYPGGGGTVHVVGAVAGGELWILVSDEGGGLQVGSRRGGLGVGLALIASATDEFTVVRRSDGGTEIRMRWRLPAPEGSRRDEDHRRGSSVSAT